MNLEVAQARTTRAFVVSDARGNTRNTTNAKFEMANIPTAVWG